MGSYNIHVPPYDYLQNIVGESVDLLQGGVSEAAFGRIQSVVGKSKQPSSSIVPCRVTAF